MDRGYERPSADYPVVLRGMTGTLSEQRQVVLKAMAAGELLPGQAGQLLQAMTTSPGALPRLRRRCRGGRPDK